MEITLKKINLKKMGFSGCENNDIDKDKEYLVIYNGNKILGKFYKQWYGWSFSWFGSFYAGLQLNTLSEVYEIEYH